MRMRPLSPLFAVFSLIATASLAVAQSIEGVVTNGTAPLANIQVVAYDGTGNWGGNAYTDTAGAYAINGLVVGKGYKIQFSDGTGTYAAEWYDDAGGWTGATEVNAPSTGIDAVMEAGVTIAGTVTEEESGTALEGAWVYAYDTARQMSVSYATTDALGGYVLSGLKAGVSYKLSYNHWPHRYEWYDDKNDWNIADAVAAPAAGIDAALWLGATIEGVVTNGTAPLANIQVAAYESGTGYSVGNVSTDGLGAYRIAGLTEGKGYKVLFTDYTGTHAAEWYSDAGGWTGATVVNASATGIDAVMEGGVSIAGTVTEDGTGIPIGGCSVQAYDTAHNVYIGNSTTDATGAYVLSGLKAGVSYKLSYNHSPHKGEWYNNKIEWHFADTVAAPATGIDAALWLGGTIEGVVTDGTDPLGNILVAAYEISTGYSVGSVWTDWGTGAYRIAGLNEGMSYKVLFTDYTGTYAAEWYDDAGDWTGATVVNASSTGIDAVMGGGVSIAGTVTEEGTGTPLEGCSVQAYDAAHNANVCYTSTDALGGYVLAGLKAGVSYKLSYSHSPHKGEWYDDKAEWAVADGVAAPAASIDAALGFGGTIEGVVTDGTYPLADIRVEAYESATGEWGGSADTDAMGAYRITALDEGSAYKVVFIDHAGAYAAEWYNDAGDWTGATEVNASSTGIDAVLEVGVSIAGTVTEEGSGTPLEGAWVYAYDTAQEISLFGVSTDALGRYALSGLKAGTSYAVSFSHSIYASEWYDDKAVRALADAVPAPAAAIDAQLAYPGPSGLRINFQPSSVPLPVSFGYNDRGAAPEGHIGPEGVLIYGWH